MKTTLAGTHVMGLMMSLNSYLFNAQNKKISMHLLVNDAQTRASL